MPPGEKDSTPIGPGSSSPPASSSPASPPASRGEELRKGVVQVGALAVVAAGAFFGLVPIPAAVLAVVAIAAPTSVGHVRALLLGGNDDNQERKRKP